MLVLYGLGTIVGAGIYALVGEVAGRAGMYAPFGFLMASALAATTVLSFAELSARLPLSAGEAAYVHEGFGVASLATFVGLVVATAGCVSAATVANGFVGYLAELATVPRAPVIIGFTATLGLVAAWGIRESAAAVAIMTLAEVAGLVLLIAVAWPTADVGARAAELLPPLSVDVWTGISAASLLAFFAFLGFEDMVNVAEEVRDVTRTLPLAIVIVLVLSTALYVALATVVVLVVEPSELAATDAPLALVYERATGSPAHVLSIISMLAMVNGALVQIVMAARVLYGLARQGSLPAIFARVEAATRTPAVATAVATATVTVLALAFPLALLAQGTSMLMLVSFSLVNLSLVRMKRRGPPPEGIWRVPAPVPMVGFVVSVAFFGYGMWDLLSR